MQRTQPSQTLLPCSVDGAIPFPHQPNYIAPRSSGGRIHRWADPQVGVPTQLYIAV